MLMRGTDMDDQPIYAYVALMAGKLEAFVAAQREGTLHPREWGVIIESGEGEPPEPVRLQMKAVYGFRHDAMPTIVDPEVAHALALDVTRARQ